MTEKNIRRNRYLLLVTGVILYLTLTPGDGEPSIPYADKFVHNFMFFGLTLNILYKFGEGSLRSWMLASAIALGFLIEFFQQYVPGRSMDFWDGIADCSGVILGYYYYKRYESFIVSTISKMGA